MLRLELICVGKTGRGFYSEGCAEYARRLAPFFKLTVTELEETRLAEDTPAWRARVVNDESARIIKRLPSGGARVAALCAEGARYTSEGFAELVKRAGDAGAPLVFIIGGSLGLSEELKARADVRVSLSALTMPHQLARLVLLEQLYRAATISNHIRYHK